LGNQSLQKGDLDAAKDYYEKSLELSTANNDNWARARHLDSLGLVHLGHQDYERAANYHRQAIEIGQVLKDPQGIAVASLNLGHAMLHQGEVEQANKCYARCLTLSSKVGHKLLMAYGLTGIARVGAHQGDGERAAHLIGAVNTMFRFMDVVRDPIEQAQYDEALSDLDKLLDKPTLENALAAGESMHLDDVVASALSNTEAK
jgi:tetratricopeptide (TPR) repeat protein